jgi:hypothetical protein
VRSSRSRLLLPVVFVGLAAALGSTAGASVIGKPSKGNSAPARLTHDEQVKPDAKAALRRVALVRVDRLVTKGIINHRNSTWRWQDVMQRPRTPYSGRAHTSKSRDYRRWVLSVWKKRAKQAWRQAQRPPHYDQWLCIHRYEGSWADPNAPYYGGLQMDLGFQRAYGGRLLETKGTADNWSPLEQMWVAERAHASGRGFYPWPNTARYCNLF